MCFFTHVLLVGGQTIHRGDHPCTTLPQLTDHAATAEDPGGDVARATSHDRPLYAEFRDGQYD